MPASDHWWVQPLVVSVGIVSSLLAASYTVWTNRQLARKKATLDLIEGSESKEFYQNLYFVFRRFRTDPAFRAKVLAPTDEDHWKSRASCLSYLNHYEIVSIGCDQGILDEGFYAAWMAPSVVRDWKAARELIVQSRRPVSEGGFNDTAAYAGLDAMCRRWERQRAADEARAKLWQRPR